MDHPLRMWLEKRDISVEQFAEDNELAFTTIYNHLRATYTPSVKVLQAIEAATDGDVTIRKQLEWFNAQSVS